MTNKPIKQSARGEFDLTLSYRPPFDWQSLLNFLAYRAIPGVEQVTEDSYARTFELNGIQGHALACFSKENNTVKLRIFYPQFSKQNLIINRFRALFDLLADSNRIDTSLASDSFLKHRIKRFPGLRVPGCWSGFEVAVRAILGQQVSVRAASTLVARLAARHGKPYQFGAEEFEGVREKGVRGRITYPKVDGLDYTFPESEQLVDADLAGLGIVGQRIEAIRTVALMLCNKKLRIHGDVNTEEFVNTICTVKGIGEWTAQYIAMRALNDPNAFPHSDLILRRAAAPPGETLSPKQLLRKAEAWQPWRAYAGILLWRSYQEDRKRVN